MQVFSLPGNVIRNAEAASWILSEPSAEAARRTELVLRWRQACRDGLSVRDAARAVGVPLSTLYRWEKRPEPLSTRPLRVRLPELRRRTGGRVRELRKEFPAWGRGKIAAMLRREGTAVSDGHGRPGHPGSGPQRPHGGGQRLHGPEPAEPAGAAAARGADPPRDQGRKPRTGGAGRHPLGVAAAGARRQSLHRRRLRPAVELRHGVVERDRRQRRPLSRQAGRQSPLPGRGRPGRRRLRAHG